MDLRQMTCGFAGTPPAWGGLVRVLVMAVVLVVGVTAVSGVALAENRTEAPTAVEAKAVSLQELLTKGGFLMWPLGLCSIIVLAFAVERFLSLRSGKVIPTRVVRSVEDGLASGDFEATLKQCEEDGSPAGRILTAGLRHRACSAQEMEHAMEEVGRREVSRLRDNILPLNVIANIAPLLGLLGTVFGMIRAFKIVAGGTGFGKPEALAAGIYEALVTTAVGLTVAIPALALYYYFNGRIVRILRRIDDVAARLVDRSRAEEVPA